MTPFSWAHIRRRAGIEDAIAAVGCLVGSCGNFEAPELDLLVVDTDELKEFLDSAPMDCARFTSATEIISMLMVSTISPMVCPGLRYLWPIEFLRPVLDLCKGWLSYDYAPIPSENCKCNTEMSPCPPSHAVQCAILGSGYVILEISEFDTL